MSLSVLVMPKELGPGTIVALDAIAHRRVHQDARHGGPEHDDEHFQGALALAGAAYAWHAALSPEERKRARLHWSKLHWLWQQIWPSGWTYGWSPKTPREDLIDAAALIVAEIERIDRAEAASKS